MRVVLQGLLLLVMALPALALPCNDWQLWRNFGNSFIQADGRVLADESEQRYSTSEGQAYALFFMLVANDKEGFERVLQWTRSNLAAGDLAARLPGWQWGRKADGSWGLSDQNSASDADSWLAYVLLEAGRLWNEPRYRAEGNLLLANIRIHLIRNMPGLGAMLLPAESGFDLEQGGVRFNPSYYPVQVLRVFSAADPSGPWDELIENSLKMLQSNNEKGYAPDWVAYVPGRGFLPDPQSGATGAHDAIRVYLWWGMLSHRDPMWEKLKGTIEGMNQLIPRQAVTPPLSVDASTGLMSGISPPGFSAALLPYFNSMKNSAALRLQQERLIVYQDPVSGLSVNRRYYDQVLALFGQGWLERRFSFSAQGQLVVQWKNTCSAKK